MAILWRSMFNILVLRNTDTTLPWSPLCAELIGLGTLASLSELAWTRAFKHWPKTATTTGTVNELPVARNKPDFDSRFANSGLKPCNAQRSTG
jgi:hypothetical protein